MDNDMWAVTEANRVSWNQIAGRRMGDPAEFYRGGGVRLKDFGSFPAMGRAATKA